MFKFILKLLGWLAAIGAVVAAIAAWDKSNKSDYVEIYGDDEEELF